MLNNCSFFLADVVEPVNQTGDLSVGLFNLTLELFAFRANSLRDTLMEEKHHVHEGHEVVMQLFFGGIIVVNWADRELPDEARFIGEITASEGSAGVNPKVS